MRKLLLPLLAAVILVAWGGILIYHQQPQGQEPPAYVETGGGQYNAPAAKGTVRDQSTSPVADAETGASYPAATREQIEQEYINRLQTLASDYEARLIAMISSAALEIEMVRKADPGAAIGPFAERYHHDGMALEAECDEHFYQLLAEFESALRGGSYPLDTAVATKEAYEARKCARVDQLTIEIK
ncbi:MAG: hypothetical protein PHP51_05245 [Desulfotomaculaceae bacterium]|nr:hypothetical protein [Desulfotomaculaceae bacterium]MDD4767436.1 hypothetical protein [Desulfotomaculaceae bacterium]